jgi:hypothetical protein
VLKVRFGGGSDGLVSVLSQEFFSRKARSRYEPERFKSAKVKVSSNKNDKDEAGQKRPNQKVGC